jgi:hypothetical protein
VLSIFITGVGKVNTSPAALSMGKRVYQMCLAKMGEWDEFFSTDPPDHTRDGKCYADLTRFCSQELEREQYKSKRKCTLLKPVHLSYRRQSEDSETWVSMWPDIDATTVLDVVIVVSRQPNADKCVSEMHNIVCYLAGHVNDDTLYVLVLDPLVSSGSISSSDFKIEITVVEQRLGWEEEEIIKSVKKAVYEVIKRANYG